jgi:hypothetical protein
MLGFKVRVVNSRKLYDGVLGLGVGAPINLLDVFSRHSLLHAHLWPSNILTLDHIVVLFSPNLFHLKFLFLIPSKCSIIGV